MSEIVQELLEREITGLREELEDSEKEAKRWRDLVWSCRNLLTNGRPAAEVAELMTNVLEKEGE